MVGGSGGGKNECPPDDEVLDEFADMGRRRGMAVAYDDGGERLS